MHMEKSTKPQFTSHVQRRCFHLSHKRLEWHERSFVVRCRNSRKGAHPPRASQTPREARSRVGAHSSKLWPYTRNWAESRGLALFCKWALFRETTVRIWNASHHAHSRVDTLPQLFFASFFFFFFFGFCFAVCFCVTTRYVIYWDMTALLTCCLRFAVVSVK